MNANSSKGPEFVMVKMTLNDCADYCSARVRKLGPAKKTGVLNAIKNAFNFKAEISDDQVEKVYAILKNRKLFADESGKIVWL